MNIDNYRVFIRVAKIGNLTAAAEQLGYTQSGISHIVSALEQEFGFQLLRRSKTGVSLTQEGERILQTLREVVNRDDMLKQIAAEIKGVRMGKVRVGAFSSVAVCWLPKIIAEFSNEYPNISIDVSVGTYKTIEDMIIAEEVDCGFMSGTMHKNDRNRGTFNRHGFACMRSIYALHGELGQKAFGGCDSMTNAEKQRIRSFQNGAAML